MNDEETTGRLDVFLHFLNLREERLLPPKNRYLRYRIFSRDPCFRFATLFQRSILYRSLCFFNFPRNLSRFLRFRDKWRMKIRKKKKEKDKRGLSIIDARWHVKANERIKNFDFVRRDTKIRWGIRDKKWTKIHTGNAIAASINTYT